jgi:hypothetical protein
MPFIFPKISLQINKKKEKLKKQKLINLDWIIGCCVGKRLLD